MAINYIDWFKNQIQQEFENAMELSNVSYEVVEEYTNRPNVDVLFILKILTGSIENGIIRIPFQLMIEINQKYEKNVVDMLNNFAIYWNEKVTHIDDNLFKHFYSTATSLGTGIDKGLYKANCYTLNINIIQYNNPMDIDSVKIDGTELKFISFAYSYSATTSLSGGYGNNNEQTSTNTSAIGIFTVSFISNSKIEYIEDNLINIANINQIYTFNFTKIVGGSIKEYSLPCIITNASISKDFNGISMSTITLTRGGL